MAKFLLLALLILLTPLANTSQASGSGNGPPHFDPKKFHSPVAVNAPEAEMPDAARRSQRSGACVVSLTVDIKGNPQNLQLLRCSDPVFAQNSIDAAKRYRFKPARTLADDSPVAVIVTIEINFLFPYSNTGKTPPSPLVQVSFFASSDPNPGTPDAKGIYLLSKAFGVPKMTRFVGKGFVRAAQPFPDGVGCEAVLTLDANGQPTDAQVTKCDDPSLEESAAASLLASQYTPATLNGTSVPVRANVHLTYDGYSAPRR